MFTDYDENDVLTIAFNGGLDEQGDACYFMIQSAEEQSSESEAYYIEKNDQSMSGYGGVEKVRIAESRIRFEFDEIGNGNVKENYIEIKLQCSDKELTDLKNNLRTIFKVIQ